MDFENETCLGKFTRTVLDNVTLATIFKFEHLAAYIVPPFFGIIIIIGIVGNSLVIYVVASNKSMRNVTNILITGLALADLCFLITCISMRTIPYFTLNWPLGDAMCKIVQFLTFALAYISIYILVWMSIIRYLAISCPLASINFRTNRNAYIVLAVTALVIFGANVPVLGIFHVELYHGYGDERLVCISNVCTNDERNILAVFFVIGYLVPLTLIFVLYGLILRTLMKAGELGAGSLRSTTSKWRAARMVITVVLTFMLCWLPAEILFIIEFLENRPVSIQWLFLQVFAQVFAYANSCINPILYALLSANFRKGFRIALFRTCRIGRKLKTYNSGKNSEKYFRKNSSTSAMTL
ncbi:allatostatin-A receptor-like [Lineus longissimus]|uniref:allatostatin-A receptor-like n=1 Tax=Lineus longissimus TaxID=88925 RepID=UPI002B4D7973